jgi:hypothetical protein
LRPTIKAIDINHLNAGALQYSRLNRPQAASTSWLLIWRFSKDTDTQLVKVNPDVPVVILLNLVSEPRQLGKPKDDRASTIGHFSKARLQLAALPTNGVQQVKFNLRGSGDGRRRATFDNSFENNWSTQWSRPIRSPLRSPIFL